MRRFDIVHLDTERGNLWYGLAAYFASIPHIFRTVHNIFPFTGLLRARRKLQRGILRKIGVKSISISPTVQAMEMERFNNETELVANWFDSKKYHPATPEQRVRARKDLGLEDDTFAICTVAGCWPYKNHDAILRALSMIDRETRIVYLHAGMEPSDHPERKLAEELGIADRVRFLGIVPDVLPVLYASDAYLMPSLWEGFGCAAIEAMGAGVPPILAEVAGLRDFKGISPAISWVEPAAKSIADALLAWYEMPQVALRDIGRQISTGTHSKYGLENGARRYAELYQECGR
jgi:glycosyltransferase involved in cell wall biosynthesis